MLKLLSRTDLSTLINESPETAIDMLKEAYPTFDMKSDYKVLGAMEDIITGDRRCTGNLKRFLEMYGRGLLKKNNVLFQQGSLHEKFKILSDDSMHYSSDGVLSKGLALSYVLAASVKESKGQDNDSIELDRFSYRALLDLCDYGFGPELYANQIFQEAKAQNRSITAKEFFFLSCWEVFVPDVNYFEYVKMVKEEVENEDAALLEALCGSATVFALYDLELSKISDVRFSHFDNFPLRCLMLQENFPVDVYDYFAEGAYGKRYQADSVMAEIIKHLGENKVVQEILDSYSVRIGEDFSNFRAKEWKVTRHDGPSALIYDLYKYEGVVNGDLNYLLNQELITIDDVLSVLTHDVILKHGRGLFDHANNQKVMEATRLKVGALKKIEGFNMLRKNESVNNMVTILSAV